MISELKIENSAAQDMLLFVCPMFLYPRIRSEYGYMYIYEYMYIYDGNFSNTSFT